MRAMSISLVLNEPETDALRQSAQRALRRPRDQARYLLRLALLGTGEIPPRGAGAIEVATEPDATDPSAQEQRP